MGIKIVSEGQNEGTATAETPGVRCSENAASGELGRIWQQLLGVDSIGANDNFFDLGGDSILAIHLFAEIEKVFKIKLPVSVLFDAPTLEELAETIRRADRRQGDVTDHDR
jgi:acyl carrier protein